MLKFAIAFCLITLADLNPRVGVYTNLIFVQHSPIVSFYWQQVHKLNESDIATEFSSYVMKHDLTLDAQKWIIYGLWPVDSEGVYISFCQTISGITPEFQGFNKSFSERLKAKWPVLKPNRDEKSIWEEEFNMRGCCVSAYTKYYFDITYNLSEKYNIGDILGAAGIFPGGTYKFNRLNEAITNALGTAALLHCIDAENTEEQLLLEVQTCFTPALDLVDCEYGNDRSGIYQCNRKNKIKYFGL